MTAAVLAPAALPALMSITLSPMMRQSHVWTFMALRVFMRASGEGFGLCVSWAVRMQVKYCAKPKFCSSSAIVAFGALRIVMSVSFAFCWSVSKARWMLGMGLALTCAML